MGSATKYQRTLFEPEHELFRESYRAFLDRHVAPYHDEWEKTKIVDRGVWLEAGKYGATMSLCRPKPIPLYRPALVSQLLHRGIDHRDRDDRARNR